MFLNILIWILINGMKFAYIQWLQNTRYLSLFFHLIKSKEHKGKQISNPK